ncbi:hypothetical protein [Klenkia terrae]|uniref:Ribosomally synthesized peptide with SipW-like signal peptide n=1 Tax=Klenkia terrae TaxID=1052259 RepID=A0ABU8E908_9ACTN|nr:hypothetical protein [Klenkia terrae]
MSGRHRRSTGRRGAGRVVVLATALALLLGGTGVAWAAWSATGGGSTQARAVTPVDLTVTAVPQLNPIFPRTGTTYANPATGTIGFTITNANPYPVSLTTLTLGNGVATDTAACPAGNVLPVVASINRSGAAAIVVAANSTSAAVVLTGAVYMRADAPSGCAGATFTVPVTLSGTSL